MAGHTKPDASFPLVMEEKRVALLNHLIGVCEFPEHTFYTKCHHPAKKDAMDSGMCAFF